VSSGPRKIYRLSRRGNRRLNHAIHMAAITQIRKKHSQGRAYYDKKLAEGKTPKEALRALKRQVSNASSPACRPMPGAPQPAREAREGSRERLCRQRGRPVRDQGPSTSRGVLGHSETMPGTRS
jgi:Transposase IS116/IS110/IS902 family